MQPYRSDDEEYDARYAGRTRRQLVLWGLSRDEALYSQGPNAFTHRAAMYEARIYAAATRSSSFETASTMRIAPRTTTTTTTHQDGRDATGGGLGDLDDLPAELVILVLEHCTLRTLLRLLRVNRAAHAVVRRCLRDFDAVADTIKGNKARARGPYPRIWATLVRIHTFRGLRQLMLGKVCDKCGEAGAARLRVAKVKVLCDKCDSPLSKRL